VRQRGYLALLIGVLGLLLIGSSGCQQAAPAQPAAPAGQSSGAQPSGGAAAAPIKIGVPLPLTGKNAPFGVIIKNGFDMAQEEINAKGGVRGGSKLQLVFEDDTSQDPVAKSAAEKLITQDKVVMLTGEFASSSTYPVAQTAEQLKIPFLVTTGAADNITQQGWKYIFRMAQPSAEFDNALKDFMENVAKPQSIAIIFENTLFGTSNSDAMKKWADSKGVKVVQMESYDAGSPDYKPLLTKTKAANPDVVYFVSYLLDATLLMRQSKEIDLNPKMFAGAAAGFSIPDFLTGAGDTGEYVVSSSMWEQGVPYPGAKDFVPAYQKKYNSLPSYHGVQSYAGTYVIADVLNRAKSLSPDDIVTALAQTDLQTLYGRIKFEAYNGFTNQARIPTVLIQVQKGKFQTVWPKEVASAPAIFPTPKWSERK